MAMPGDTAGFVKRLNAATDSAFHELDNRYGQIPLCRLVQAR